MSKYILLYNGPATDMDDMTDEQSDAVMAKWGEWMQRLGDSIVDIGAPMANGVAVVDDGSEGVASQLSGYTIIEAEGMTEAKTMVEDHPFLSDGTGQFSVEVHELLPTPV